MELVVTDVTSQKIVIKNKEEIIKNIKKSLVKYNKKLTEETLKEGIKDKATLNNLVKAIDDKRKEIKKAVMIPYDEIEVEFKEITSLIKEASDKLDVQIKAFEEEEKRKKKEDIKESFEKIVTNEFLKFDKVFDEKWLNKTVTMKKIETEISELNDKYNNDLNIIKGFNSKHEASLIAKYSETIDLGTVINEKARLEEIERISEESKIKEEQDKQILENKETKTVQVIIDMPKSKRDLEILTRAFQVRGTKEQIIALGNFMNQNNIEFQKLDLEEVR